MSKEFDPLETTVADLWVEHVQDGVAFVSARKIKVPVKHMKGELDAARAQGGQLKRFWVTYRNARGDVLGVADLTKERGSYV